MSGLVISWINSIFIELAPRAHFGYSPADSRTPSYSKYTSEGGRRKTGRDRHIGGASCNELMAYSLILSCCCHIYCIGKKLRKKLNIRGGCIDDFLSHLMCEVKICGTHGMLHRKFHSIFHMFMVLLFVNKIWLGLHYNFVTWLFGHLADLAS